MDGESILAAGMYLSGIVIAMYGAYWAGRYKGRAEGRTEVHLNAVVLPQGYAVWVERQQ